MGQLRTTNKRRKRAAAARLTHGEPVATTQDATVSPKDAA
jgi:hypothetical protein